MESPLIQQTFVPSDTNHQSGMPTPPSSFGVPAPAPIELGPDGYKLLNSIISTEPLFMNKLTGYLYSCVLIPTKTDDKNSPFSGYTLRKLGNPWKPLISNIEGFQLIMNQILLDCSEAMSTAKLTSDIFRIQEHAYRSALNVAILLVSNKDTWGFNNPTIIRPLGHAIYQNVVAIASRSIADKSNIPIITRILHPNMWNGMNSPSHNPELARRSFVGGWRI